MILKPSNFTKPIAPKDRKNASIATKWSFTTYFKNTIMFAKLNKRLWWAVIPINKLALPDKLAIKEVIKLQDLPWEHLFSISFLQLPIKARILS